MKKKNPINLTASPIFKKKDTSKSNLNFDQAIAEILNRNKITRPEWNGVKAFLVGEYLMIQTTDGLTHQWILREVDLVGTDYYVID